LQAQDQGMSQLQISTMLGYQNSNPLVLFQRSEVKIKRYYNVALLCDTVVKAYTRVDIRSKPHTIDLELDGKTVTLTPSDTHFISMLSDLGEETLGIPADTCWLFGNQNDKINVYTFLPFSGWEFIAAIQKGENGNIVMFTPENVLEMISDNPDAMQLLEQGEIEDAIRVYNGRWVSADGYFSKRKRGKKK
jgi:hypothetical protein